MDLVVLEGDIRIFEIFEKTSIYRLISPGFVFLGHVSSLLSIDILFHKLGFCHGNQVINR